MYSSESLNRFQNRKNPDELLFELDGDFPPSPKLKLNPPALSSWPRFGDDDPKSENPPPKDSLS